MKKYIQLEIPFEIEEWKDIEGYEGLYEISSLGRVRSLNYNHNPGEIRVLKPHDGRYLRIELHKNGIRKWFSIHRLVAMAFLPNTENYPCVNHKDENPHNNCLDNLEWCTISYNTSYGNGPKKAWNSRRKNDPTSQWILKSLETKQKNNANNKEKPVIQKTKDNIIINVFKSASCAANYNDSFRKQINRCCLGQRKTAHGYKWEYA